MKRTPLTRKTSLRPVSAKRTAYRASGEGQDALRYMQAVKQLPCCVCGAAPPNDAHHCHHDRYGTRKASDFDTIPLCHDGCHQGPHGVHAEKRSWRERNGPDHGYIRETRAKVFAITGVDFVPTRRYVCVATEERHMTITEDIRGNAWQWAVTLKGGPLADLKARAQEIREETKDAMTSYYVKQLDGVEIQMEFLKGDGK